jgi:hypothetical protein
MPFCKVSSSTTTFAKILEHVTIGIHTPEYGLGKRAARY